MIRAAKKADMPRLLDIYNYEVQNGTSTFDLNVKTLDERMEWFAAHNIGNHPLIVLEMDGVIAGYACLSSYRDKEAYAAAVELSVYIAPECRRRGAARRLMEAIIGMARERDDIHTIVSVITEGNEASVKLHEDFGFIYCGILKEVGEKFGRKLGIVNYQLIL